MVLLALVLAAGGVWAVVRGCIDEYQDRRRVEGRPARRIEQDVEPDADESVLMDEIEEWLKQQR